MSAALATFGGHMREREDERQVAGAARREASCSGSGWSSGKDLAGTEALHRCPARVTWIGEGGTTQDPSRQSLGGGMALARLPKGRDLERVLAGP